MKFNWGYGILMFVLLFMAFILTLVYKCSKQRVDLVSKTYYEQELKYDQQMAKEKNSSVLSDSLLVRYDSGRKSILINYPSTVDIKNLSGNIIFFKPDNAAFDFNKPVLCDGNFAQSIPVSGMQHGWWNIKVDWKTGATPYFASARIYIN